MDATDIPDYLILLALTIAGIVCWRLARRLKRRPIRVAARISSLLVAIGCVALISLFAVLGFFERGMWTDFNFPSPDGKHIAKLRFVTPGAMGDDMAVVLLRKHWSSSWERIYYEPGTQDSGGQDAEVHWIDSTHLLVRYHAIRYSSENEMKTLVESRCPSESLGIKITCEGD